MILCWDRITVIWRPCLETSRCQMFLFSCCRLESTWGKETSWTVSTLWTLWVSPPRKASTADPAAVAWCCVRQRFWFVGPTSDLKTASCSGSYTSSSWFSERLVLCWLPVSGCRNLGSLWLTTTLLPLFLPLDGVIIIDPEALQGRKGQYPNTARLTYMLSNDWFH